MKQHKRKIRCGKRRLSGHAMLGTIATLGMLASTTLATFGTTLTGTQQTNKTAAALAQAKQALLSRAASDANHPGSLPCPDAITNIAGNNVPNDGVADLLAGPACPSNIGRLPWRTLGLPDLRDADGERLWYLLAPAYTDSPAKIINPGTSGQISAYECADDQPAAPAWPCDNPRAVATTPWVAVVFAPGKLLGAQLRDAAHMNDYAQFIESYNPADPLRLRIAAGAAHNDRIAAISSADVFAAVQRRVANELQAALTKYIAATALQGQARLPWPAAACASSTQCAATALTSPLPDTTRGFLPSDDAELNQIMSAQNMAWFDQNHWRTTFSYVIDANCTAAGAVAQCGEAVAALNATSLPADTTLIGGAANALKPGTRGVFAFAGVAGDNTKTRLAFALQ